MDKYHQSLIEKYLNRSLSVTQRDDFNELMRTSQGLRLIEDQFDQEWKAPDFSQKVNAMADVPYLKMYKRLSKEINTSKYTLVKRWIVYVASAATLLIIISLGIVGVNSIMTQMQPPIYTSISVPRGEKLQLILQDGTRVWLNANSTLYYPLEFKGDNRTVKLEGEAFFDVVSNEKHPFIVQANEVDVKVLGTKFNVSAYQTNERIEVALLEGAVKFYKREAGDHTGLQLAPGELVQYNTKTDAIKLLPQKNVIEQTLWRDDIYQFRDASLRDVVEVLQRAYGCNIQVDSSLLDKYSYTMLIEKVQPQEVFRRMQIITPIKIQENNGVWYIAEKH